MKKFAFISVLFLSFVLICNGQWTYDNLSEDKTHMGVAVLGSKAYLAGGADINNNEISTIEIYDGETGEWNTDNNLSVARRLIGGVACGSKVFFAGGINFNTWVEYSEVDVFDTLTQEWEVINLSVPRFGVAAVSNGNTVLFAGGGIADASSWLSYDIVDIYNVETSEWSTATLSEARDVRAATVVGDLALFAGGGSVVGSVSKTVDIYNFTDGTWSVDSLSVARGWIQAVSVGNKALFAGGMTGNNVCSDVVDIYDATDGTWSVDTLSFPRAFSNNTCGANVCGDKAFFAGGGYLDINTIYWQDVYDNIDIYDESSETWSQDNLNIARIEHIVAGVANQLVVAGGYNSSWQAISSVEIFTCPPSSCLPEGITFSSQEDIDNFQINHPYCSEIEGDVLINGLDITNLNGLNALAAIGGNLDIHGNETLTNLIGLENLISIGGSINLGEHDLGGNPSLVNLLGLNNLIYIGGSLSVYDNESLSSFAGLENITTISGSLAIGIHVIGGNQSLTSLTGLEGLTSIGGGLMIEINSSLENLAELSALTSIGGSLLIGGNSSLTSITGLESLTSIGENLYIGYGGLMGVELGNPSLTSLTALSNVTSIGGNLGIGKNDILPSLTGLENIEPESIVDLWIIENNLLSNCAVQSICDYLVPPNGEIDIHDNFTGCNSQEEVEDSCGIINPYVTEVQFLESFTISPNPCSVSANLRFSIYEQGFTICDLFEVSGVRVKSILNEERIPGTYQLEIDLSDLKPGIYFCILKTSEGIQTKKIIKL